MRKEMFYLENMLKTKDVANKFGVSPRTIRYWIKYFSLKCDLNHAGHYMIDRKNFEQLMFIHEQLKLGKKMEDIRLPGMGKNVSSDKLDERFNRLLNYIDQLDQKIQSKAGEVVEYQILQHRKEIDDITHLLDDLNERLKKIEERLNEDAEHLITLEKMREENRGKKKRFASIFSFL